MSSYLCYGYIFDVKTMASIMGVMTAKKRKCSFCDYVPENELHKFCANCGRTLEAPLTDLTATEAVEVFQRKAGKPLGNINAFRATDKVCICYVFTSSGDFPTCTASMEDFPWRKVREEVESYIRKACVPNIPIEFRPRLFAYLG